MGAGRMKKSMEHDIPEQVRQLSRRIRESRISIYAGQTAFFMMLSFFPFLLFFFLLLNLTPITEETFYAFVSGFIPSSFQEVMYTFSHQIYTDNIGGKLSATIITAVYLSSKSFWSIQQGLNSMYQVKETRNRFLLRIYSVLYSIVFAVMLVVVLGVMVFGDWIVNKILVRFDAASDIFEWVLQFKNWICIPLLLLFFWILYVLVPDRKSRWRHRWRKQLPGAAFAAAGWMIFSYAFSIYVNNYTRYSTFYGTMATIALVMLWVYGCMYVLFLGGLLNSILPDVQILFCSIRRERKTLRKQYKGELKYMFGWKKWRKKDKELEEIILHLENNASNNYKDAAQKNFQELKQQYAQMKEKNLLNERQTDYYAGQIAEYEKQMAAFYHNPEVHRK